MEDLIYYLPVKSLVVIWMTALAGSAAAKTLAVGPLGAADEWSREASTNVVVSTGGDELRAFTLSLACDATPSNNVSVSLGFDVNGDGILQSRAAELTVGWDCGAWFVREELSGRVASEARDHGRRTFVWRMVVGEDGEPKALLASDDGALFAAAAQRPLRTWFCREWNLARVAVRGLPAADEAISVFASRIGLAVKVR